MSEPRYADLLELAQREQELVENGRFEELEAVGEEWEALAASLPDPAPEDREVIEQIELVVWSTVASLHKGMRDVHGTVALINRGRRAIASYAGQARAPLAAVDARI